MMEILTRVLTQDASAEKTWDFNPRGSERQQTSCSKTICKRNNNYRPSDLQLPREAGTPHQVWCVPEPIGIWCSSCFSPNNLTRIGKTRETKR